MLFHQTDSIMRTILFCCGIALAQTAFCQEQLGLRLENYAGVSSLSLNPAGNLSNPLAWDVNLVGAGFFFENNYAYLQQTNLPELWRRRNDAEFILAKDIEGQPPANAFIADFYDDGRKRYAALSSIVMGPSVVVKIQDKHSFGIFTNFRSVESTKNIPNPYSYYRYDERPLGEEFSVAPFEGAFLSWSEIGLNYALKIPTSNGAIGFGANLRFLRGHEAAFLESQTGFGHVRLSKDAFSVSHADTRIGYTNSSLDGEDFNLEKNGSGVALDLGVLLLAQVDEDGYKFRLGASLLDLGYLKFNKNARLHHIQSDSLIQINASNYEDYAADEHENFMRQLSFEALGDSLASFENDAFTMALPAALSLQADYAFTPNFFLNALLVQEIPTVAIAPRRGNLLALTPRFEHRWFSASLPVSVYNWKKMHVGLAARLGWLVVGSDNIASIFGRQDFTGTDFYIALKVNPFNLNLNLGGGGNGGNGKRRFGGKGKVKCYDF